MKVQLTTKISEMEERAKRYVKSLYPDPRDWKTLAFIDCRKDYLHGEIDQAKIDADRTVEWFKQNWRKYIDTDADGMIRFAGWEADYRKAMED